MTTQDLAAVSGATGFIGSAVVRKLLEEGRKVRALVEPRANPKNLEGLPADRVERVEVDVCDAKGMRKALEGASAFYHLAAIYKVWMPDPTPIHRVNIEGTLTSLLAARDVGVRRVIYTSSIAAVGLKDDASPADESTPWNLWNIANDYIASKYQAERVVMRLAEAGFPVVIVNPAFPFGPRDIGPTPTGGIILSFLRGKMPGVGKGGFCAVDVDDVAAAHVAAETRGRFGERYILGNHNVSFRAFLELVADVAGKKAPRLPIPSGLARAMAFGLESWSDHVSHTPPLATYKSVRYMQEYAYFNGEKARRELGMPCTPLRTSVEHAIEYFRTNGMV